LLKNIQSKEPKEIIEDTIVDNAKIEKIKSGFDSMKSNYPETNKEKPETKN